MHVEAGIVRYPSFDAGMLVSRVVVCDRMKVQFFRRFPVDLFEQGQPFHMRMPRFRATYNFSLQVIRKGELGGGYVAVVVEGDGDQGEETRLESSLPPIWV